MTVIYNYGKHRSNEIKVDGQILKCHINVTFLFARDVEIG